MTSTDDGPAPYLLTDPTTGRPILMAPRRRRRPLLTGQPTETDACPFCEGHEHLTPPECAAARPNDSAADGPGWLVRAFDNLYPAAAHHEVVAEGPGHATQPAALAAEVWTAALAIYRQRIVAMEGRPDVELAYWFKNVGRSAGASIAHNHTQILGLSMLPPRLELELKHSRGRPCVHCEEIATAEEEGRLVARGEHHVVLCPRAPKMHYETWVLPLDHGARFTAAEYDEDLGQILHLLFRSLAGAFDEPPFNMFLHRVPGESFHWHFEVQPRMGTVAGLELGGDMYINSVTAAESAARLRGDG